MTLHTITTTSTTQIQLAGNDSLYLGRNGALVRDGLGGAIEDQNGSMTTFSQSRIAIDGSIFSTDKAIAFSEAAYFNLQVGQSGSIASYSTAVSVTEDAGSSERFVVSNAGTISSSASSGLVLQGSAAHPNVAIDINNSGLISGNGGKGIFTDSGFLTTDLINSGEISSPYDDGAYLAGTGAKTILNTGTIQSLKTGVSFHETGSGTVSNSGTISGDDHGITAGGRLTVVNSGEITSASVTGTTIATADGLDLRNTGEISGGTIAISAAGNTRIINAGTIIGAVNIDSTSGNSVTNTGEILGSVALGDGNDTYIGKRGMVTDGVFGGNGADRLVGGVNEDVLYGGGDADILRGRAGDDTIVGGGGADRMWGGRDEDTFVFESTSDAGMGAAADKIFRFKSGTDQIDLEALDIARYIGSNHFSGTHSEVRVKELKKLTLVQIDSDGDGTADMQIKLIGAKGVDAGDFIL